MAHRVLRDFLFSHDGITSLPAVVGAEVDLPADAVAGLLAEGYIAADAPDEPPAVTPKRGKRA